MRILMTLIAVFALAPLAQGQGGHGLFIFADEGQDQDHAATDFFHTRIPFSKAVRLPWPPASAALVAAWRGHRIFG